MIEVSRPLCGQAAPALERSIDLTVAPGAFVVLPGRSGWGKTTLLNVSAGFVSPDFGRRQLPRQADHGPVADRAVVFQHHALLPWLDVADNIAFPLKHARLRGGARTPRR